MSDLQIDTVANEILDAVLEEGDGDPNETSVDTAKPENTLTESQAANEVLQAVEETAPEAEPETPAIEPPVSWTAEAKDKFRALPPDLQQYVSQRESEREQGYSKTRQELADERKATEAERKTAESERKAYAERLGAFVQVATKFNPKLAEWQQRDWTRYAAENPLEVQAEWFAYQQQLGAIASANAEIDRVQQQTLAESRKKAHDVLSQKLDFWKDEQKRAAFQNELREWAKTQDITDEEINSIENPKVLLVTRKAMLYDKLQAEQAKIAAAKKVPPPGKVLKPQAKDEGTDNPRAEALDRRAAKSGRLDDQAAAILARL